MNPLNYMANKFDGLLGLPRRLYERGLNKSDVTKAATYSPALTLTSSDCLENLRSTLSKNLPAYVNGVLFGLPELFKRFATSPWYEWGSRFTEYVTEGLKAPLGTQIATGLGFLSTVTVFAVTGAAIYRSRRPSQITKTPTPPPGLPSPSLPAAPTETQETQTE